MFDDSFNTSINQAIMESLGGYVEAKSGDGFYQKKVRDSICINLYPKVEYESKFFVADYRFPDIQVEIEGKPYYFFGESDVRSLLLMSGPSFIFFTIESNNMTWDEYGRISGMERKNDEPVIYHDKESDTYILTNSYEKLELYNKYIYILIELYRHYFRVFEQWLIDQLT